MRSRVLVVPLFVVAMTLLTACGGDGNADDGDTGVAVDSPTAIPNDPGPSPELDGPASLYSLSHDDLGPGYITDIAATYVLTADNYGATQPFRDVDGPAKLKEWGYTGGYETSYTPEGRNTAVLNGAHYIRVETHLMANAAGAEQLFNYFVDFVAGTVSEPITVNGIGQQFAAWRFVDAEHPVGDSSVASEYHQYIFRRGNLVAAVQTIGAEPFMDLSAVYQLAHIIDQKAMGEIELVEPTPVSSVTSN